MLLHLKWEMSSWHLTRQVVPRRYHGKRHTTGKLIISFEKKVERIMCGQRGALIPKKVLECESNLEIRAGLPESVLMFTQ